DPGLGDGQRILFPAVDGLQFLACRVHHPQPEIAHRVGDAGGGGDRAASAGLHSRRRPRAFLVESVSLGISFSVRSTSTGVLVFTQTWASLKCLAGTFSRASPTVLAGMSRPFLVELKSYVLRKIRSSVVTTLSFSGI